MGVYVWIPKVCCGEELQFQSKSHPSMEYGTVDLNEVPVEMARDISGDSQECPHCLRRYTIQRKMRDMDTVPMEIVCDNEDEVVEQQEQEDDEMEKRLQRIERQLGLK